MSGAAAAGRLNIAARNADSRKAVHLRPLQYNAKVPGQQKLCTGLCRGSVHGLYTMDILRQIDTAHRLKARPDYTGTRKQGLFSKYDL